MHLQRHQNCNLLHHFPKILSLNHSSSYQHLHSNHLSPYLIAGIFHQNLSFLWFQSRGFDLMTCDSNFMILVKLFLNHFLAENTYFTNHIEWSEHKIIILKPAKKYQIIQQCHNFKNFLINNFQHCPFHYQVNIL